MSKKKTQTARSSGKSAAGSSARGKPAAATAAGSPAGPMNIDLLAEITRLMKENDLNTVDVRDGDRRIVLKRGAPIAPAYAAAPAMISMPAPLPHAATTAASPAPAASAGGGAAGASPAAPADLDAGLVPIKSPMVGTVYLKPAPDAKQYVNTGSQIGPETVVCLIEAMKVFNEIKAETSGTIAKILVTDGQTVEFGQPLFYVKH